MISDYLQLLSPLISVFFGLGFYFIGSFLINIFNFRLVVNKISDPHYQYASISICFFLLISYPMTLYGLLSKQYVTIISLIVLLAGFIFFFILLSKNYNLCNKNIKIKIFFKF
jgi:hypothetical protein